MPLAAEHDGKGRLDGGSGTHIAAGGVRVDSQVDGRRRKVRSGREAVHGRVEQLGNVVVGGESRWALDGADEVRSFSFAAAFRRDFYSIARAISPPR